MSNGLFRGREFSQIDPLTLSHEHDRISELREDVRLADLGARQVGASTSPPSPEPAPPPAVPITRDPALYVIETFQLYTVNGDLGVLRPPLDSIMVPGNGQRTIYVHRTVTSTFEQSFSSSALETSSEASSNALTTDVSKASSTQSSTDTFEYDLKSSVRVRGEVGLDVFKGRGDLNARTSSTAVHDGVSDAVQSAVQKQALSTKSATAEQQVRVDDKTSNSNSDERQDTLFIDNSKNASGVNYAICRLGVEKITALCLVNVMIGFYDARLNQTTEHPITQLDEVLQSAIADDVNRAELREKLIQWLAKPVFDCNSEPRKLVKQATFEGTHYLTVVPDLKTKINIERSDGTPCSVTVPGIALNKQYRIMPTQAFGAAKLVV